MAITVENAARSQVLSVHVRPVSNKRHDDGNWTWNWWSPLNFINLYSLFTVQCKIHKRLNFFNVYDHFTPYFLKLCTKVKVISRSEILNIRQTKSIINTLSTSLPITPKLAWLANVYWKWKTVYHIKEVPPWSHVVPSWICDILRVYILSYWTSEAVSHSNGPPGHPLDSHSSDSSLAIHWYQICPNSTRCKRKPFFLGGGGGGVGA